MKPKQPKKLLRIQEVMELMACSKSTVYRLVANRELEAMKVMSGLRITSESVISYQQRAISEFSESEALL